MKESELSLESSFDELIERMIVDNPVEHQKKIAESACRDKPTTEKLKPGWVFWYWEEQGNRRELKFKNIAFLAFLQDNGFGRLRVGDTSYFYVQAVNNVVRIVTPVLIKDFAMDYLREINETAVLDLVHQNSRSIFDDMRLNSLEYLEIEFLRDTNDKAFLCFKNGFVEITKNSEVLHDYGELIKMKKCIWKKQIKNHAFTPREGLSVFSQFIENTSAYELTESDRKLEEERGETHYQIGNRWVRESDYESKISAFGYSLHSFKNPSEGEVVVCIDSNFSDKNESEGGTGKSLYIGGISEIKNVVTLDGKTIDLHERFAF